eukprot:COSAG01_NODE_14583_length_1434_cov_7.250000_2_plen_71_part_00
MSATRHRTVRVFDVALKALAGEIGGATANTHLLEELRYLVTLRSQLLNCFGVHSTLSRACFRTLLQMATV